VGLSRRWDFLSRQTFSCGTQQEFLANLKGYHAACSLFIVADHRAAAFLTAIQLSIRSLSTSSGSAPASNTWSWKPLKSN
jgi:hypothetical protein